jgi:hypothetical protein
MAIMSLWIDITSSKLVIFGEGFIAVRILRQKCLKMKQNEAQQIYASLPARFLFAEKVIFGER